MKSSFSSLLKDDKGTKYKPQSLVELINKNKNSKKGSSISQQQQQHEQKLLAFIGKDLLSMSNNTNNSKNLFGSNTTTNNLIGSPSANNNINSITTGEPNRLFSKINQIPNNNNDNNFNYVSSFSSTSLPNPLQGTTTHSSPFRHNHNTIGNDDNTNENRYNSSQYQVQNNAILETKTTSIHAPVELIVRILPNNNTNNDNIDENLVTVHQSSKGLTLRAPKDGIAPASTRKRYSSSHGHGTPWRTPQRPKPKAFHFDSVISNTLTSNVSQNLIYEKVQPLVNSVLDGFNATVLAYGATGTGKTYTIMGNTKCSGILPRIVSDLFLGMKDRASANVTYDVSIGYVELYNNRFQDLLYMNEDDDSSNNNNRHGTIELHDKGRNGITLTGTDSLRTNIVSAEQAILQIKKGNSARHCNNKASSRSHAIVTFYVTKSLHDNTIVSRSKFHIVDLAGSDRLSVTSTSGQELKERQAINLSLSCLSNVLMTLSNSNTDLWLAPYRDSKLTYLLKDSLGGNSKTIFLAHINPTSEHYRETLMTLEYATKARMIRNVARHSTTTAAGGATTTVAGSINDPMNNKNNNNIINYNKHGSNSNSNNNMFLMNNTQSAILREKIRQINYLQQQVMERNEQVKELEENNISACNEAISLRNTIDTLNKQYGDEKNIINEQMSNLNASSDPSLKKEVEELRERLLVSETKHAEEKATLNANIHHIETSAMHEAEVIDDLRADLDSSRTQLGERIKQLAHSRAIAVLEADGKRLDAEIDSLHYQNETRKAKISQMKMKDEKLNKSKQQLSILHQRGELANMAKKLVKEIEDYRTYIDHVEHLAEKAIRKAQKQKQKKSLYIEGIQKVESERDEWEKKYIKAQKDIIKLKKKLTIHNNRKKGMYGSNLNKRSVFNDDVDTTSTNIEKQSVAKEGDDDNDGENNNNNNVISGGNNNTRKKRRKLRSNNTTTTLGKEPQQQDTTAELIRNGDSITTSI